MVTTFKEDVSDDVEDYPAVSKLSLESSSNDTPAPIPHVLAVHNTDDVTFNFEDGSKLNFDSKVLIRASDTFASTLGRSAIFNPLGTMTVEKNKTQGTTYQLRVSSSFIDSSDLVFLERVLLFLRTGRLRDLDVTTENAVRYLYLHFALKIRPSHDYLEHVVSRIRTPTSDLDPILAMLKCTPVTEEHILNVLQKCGERVYCIDSIQIQTKDFHCNWCNGNQHSRTCSLCYLCEHHCHTSAAFVPLAIPALWIMAAPNHELKVDILNLRKKIHKMLSDGLKNKLEFFFEMANPNMCEISPEHRPDFIDAVHVIYSKCI